MRLGIHEQSRQAACNKKKIVDERKEIMFIPLGIIRF